MTVPAPTPTPPPTSRLPLIERVAKLEELVVQMAKLHNEFASDVARELGLE